MFLSNIFWRLSWACQAYVVFLQRDALGLTLGQIGYIAAAVSGVLDGPELSGGHPGGPVSPDAGHVVDPVRARGDRAAGFHLGDLESSPAADRLPRPDRAGRGAAAPGSDIRHRGRADGDADPAQEPVRAVRFVQRHRHGDLQYRGQRRGGVFHDGDAAAVPR